MNIEKFYRTELLCHEDQQVSFFAIHMEKGQSFDILIRPAERISNSEVLYRVFAFWKDATVDELLLHPQIKEIIEGCNVSVKAVDKFRFEICVTKENIQSD